jgi:flavin reductase (DIM6/NTAB) family NADH-FMN oxidoreductase RutF
VTSAAVSPAPAEAASPAPAEAAWPAVAPPAFRAAMRHHAKGVAVITAGTGTPAGFCATSLASVSLDPPVLSFTVGLAASSWPAVREARHVLVHLLAGDQEEVARRFARPGDGKFGPGLGWRRGPLGLPVLDGVLAWLALAVVSHLPVGDHALVIGRVVRVGPDRGGMPLVHHDGGFSRLTG